MKFALVGCGRIAKKHIDAINEIDQAHLVAVCDTNIERAKKQAEYAGGVPFYSTYNEMLQQEKIDVVNILTPSGMHPEHTIDIVSKYQKHIVVEKPMALRLNDVDEMIETCDEHGVRLFVVKQNRYNLPVSKTREALEAGRFGKIVMGSVRVRWCRPQQYYDQNAWRGTWEFDGGVLTNQASHHVDLLEWMLGEPVSVMAKTDTFLSHIEVEDTGVAIIKFKSGALGVVEATTATRPKDLEGSLSILGSKGSVVIGGHAVNKMDTWNFDDATEEENQRVLTEFAEMPPNVYSFGHKRYLEHVIASIGSLRCIEHHIQIADGVRVHSQTFIPEFCHLEQDSWIGPNVVLTNAKYPHGKNAKALLNGVKVPQGAKIRTTVTVLPGVELKRNSLIGVGSVVTKNVGVNKTVRRNSVRQSSMNTKIAKKYQLKVIEDSAQAHGAMLQENGPGTWGDIAAFSFYPGKNLGAFGDAGAIVTHSEELESKVRAFINHGRMLRQKYKHAFEGANLRIDAIQAAILRIKLRHLQRSTGSRITFAKNYNAALQGIESLQLPLWIENSRQVFHLFALHHEKRDKIHTQLKKQGISAERHYLIPLHLQPAYAYMGHKKGDFPVAEKNAPNCISLPLWPEMTKEPQQEAINVLKKTA